jgi:DNA primase
MHQKNSTNQRKNPQETTKLTTSFFTKAFLSFLALSLFAFIAFPASAQTSDLRYDWTKTVGGTGTDWAYSVALDPSDNVYISGYFSNTVDFDPGAGTDNRTSAGSTDNVLTKYDASGNYQWTKTWGGTGDDRADFVTTDPSGSVYVGGVFSNTVDFDPGAGTDNRTSAGGLDVFLSKYDTSGNYQWTKTVGGTGTDYVNSVAVDSSGNVYAAGYYSNTVDFDPGAGVDNHTSAGSIDAFFSKYDASGNYQWTKTWGGTESDSSRSVTTNPSGNVYVSGQFRTTIDFDPGAGTDNRTSAGSYEVFLTKYDTSGNYQWTKTWGGTGSDYTYSVAVDSSGKVYAAGHYSNTVDFDPGAGVDNHTSAGGNDAFLTKFSTVYLDHGPVSLTLDINATIALSCDPSVTMNAIVGTGKSTINTNNQANCTVTTNNSNGYKMEWQASTDAMLNAQNDPFAAYSPSASGTPETWTIAASTSAWGAKLAATSEGYNGGTGGSGYTYPGTGWGMDDTYTSGKFLNVSSADPFQIMQKSTETDVDGETQSIMFGAEIGADKIQPTGTYTTQVTITATTL